MKKIKILGIKIDRVNFQLTLKKIEGYIKSGRPHQIATVNPEFIMATIKDAEFAKVLNATAMSVPDGAGLLWAAKFLYGKKGELTERIAGVDLVWEIAKMAEDYGWSCYFLGAKPGIAQEASQRLKLINPSLKIAGVSEGEPKMSASQVVKNIKKSQADILFVAYGAPKQDKFIYQNLSHLGVKVAMGVGGTFDFICGRQKRAPRWLQKIYLEWLWRLIREPKRFNRIITATIRFPAAVIKAKYFPKNS